jgi:hypothetical protein
MEILPEKMPFGHTVTIIEGGFGKPSVKRKYYQKQVIMRLND